MKTSCKLVTLIQYPTGELRPITYTRPQLFDDEEAAPAIRPVETPSTVNKGKRKADDIDEGINVDEEIDLIASPIPI